MSKMTLLGQKIGGISTAKGKTQQLVYEKEKGLKSTKY